MRIISRKRLVEFGDTYAVARSRLERWACVTGSARWTCFDDVRRTFPSADQVKLDSGRTVIVFNIGGGNYRLIASLYYPASSVYIKLFLTHAEYNKNKWKDIL